MQEWVGTGALLVGAGENLSLHTQSDPTKAGIAWTSSSRRGCGQCQEILALGAAGEIPQGSFGGKEEGLGCWVGRAAPAAPGDISRMVFPPQAPSHPPELLPVEIKELGQAQPLSWGCSCVLGCISRCRAAFPGWSLSRNSVARKQERGGSCGGFCVSLLPRDTCGGSFQPSAPASRLRNLSERCLIAAAGIAEQEEQGIHPEC